MLSSGDVNYAIILQISNGYLCINQASRVTECTGTLYVRTTCETQLHYMCTVNQLPRHTVDREHRYKLGFSHENEI